VNKRGIKDREGELGEKSGREREQREGQT